MHDEKCQINTVGVEGLPILHLPAVSRYRKKDTSLHDQEIPPTVSCSYSEASVSVTAQLPPVSEASSILCKDPKRKVRLKSVTKDQMADIIAAHNSMRGREDQTDMMVIRKRTRELPESNKRIVQVIEMMS